MPNLKPISHDLGVGVPVPGCYGSVTVLGECMYDLRFVACPGCDGVHHLAVRPEKPDRPKLQMHCSRCKAFFEVPPDA